MLTFDTMRIDAPMDVIRDVRFDRFNHQIRANADGSMSEVHDLDQRSRSLGISKVALKGDRLELEFSAKSLKSDYGRLISLDTIEQAIEGINGCEGIEIDPMRLIESANVFRADVTNDITVAGHVPNYVGALSMFSTTGRYRIRPERDSVTFSNGSRWISLYWKASELQKARNRELMKFVSLSNYEKVLRMENRLYSFRVLRDVLRVSQSGSPSLVEVLSAKANANLNTFRMISSPVPPVLIELEPGTVKFYKVVQRKGYEELLRQCEYDLSRFRRLVMQYVKGDPTHYLRIAKDVLHSMQEDVGADRRYELITEIERKLAA